MNDELPAAAARPAWARFLGPHAIDAALDRVCLDSGGRASVEVIGASRAGHPLRQVTVGRGSRHALVVGTPHPNEPTGALAALDLVTTLLADQGLLDRLGLTWHVVPCADPDGMRLNEAWFGGPFTYRAYGERVYRPPFPEQFEWTFHRPELDEPGLPATPESMSVMRVIDDLRPELLVSMHNGEVGGLYCYVTRPVREIGTALAALSRDTGMPLERGEADGPADLLAPGVFHAPATLDAGPFCSTDYAARHGTLGVMTEPPLWADPRAADTRPSGQTRGAIAAGIDRARSAVRDEHAGWVAALASEVDLDTARGRAVGADAASLARPWPADEAGADEQVTVALATSMQRVLDIERVRAAGHVVALLSSLPAVAVSPALDRVRAAAARRVAEWASLASRDTTFVGLDGAARSHVAVALASADALRDA